MSLQHIQYYDAAVILSVNNLNATKLGDTIASFIELGKGVVNTFYDLANIYPIGGSFNTATYRVEVPLSYITGPATINIANSNMTHPIMQGITISDLATPSGNVRRPTTLTTTANSGVLATWSDNNLLVTAKENVGSNNARRVDLGNALL